VRDEAHSFNGYENLNGAYIKKERWEEAREAAEKMLWVGERFNMPVIESRALYRMWPVSQRSGSYQRAEELYRRGLAASGNNDIRLSLATLLLREKRYA